MPRTGTDRRHSRQLYASELLHAGTFDVARDDPEFTSAGTIGERVELVFPFVPVTIEQEGEPPFIADPLRVVWYPPRQKFVRRPISQSGDRCLWLGFAPECVEQALAGGHRTTGFRTVQECRGVGNATAPLAIAGARLQRMLAVATAQTSLEIDERAICLLQHAVQTGPEPSRVPLSRHQRRCAWRARERHSGRLGSRLHRVLLSRHQRRCAWRAREVLGCRFAEELPLAVLAREAGCSPYHLARAFRRETGHSLHGFQTRLRLRAAVARLAQGAGQAGSLALDLGFCSHSHFSAAFRREYGVTPSVFRREHGLTNCRPDTSLPRARF